MFGWFPSQVATLSSRGPGWVMILVIQGYLLKTVLAQTVCRLKIVRDFEVDMVLHSLGLLGELR